MTSEVAALRPRVVRCFEPAHPGFPLCDQSISLRSRVQGRRSHRLPPHPDLPLRRHPRIRMQTGEAHRFAVGEARDKGRKRANRFCATFVGTCILGVQ